jgi:hypothetical protein
LASSRKTSPNFSRNKKGKVGHKMHLPAREKPFLFSKNVPSKKEENLRRVQEKELRHASLFARRDGAFDQIEVRSDVPLRRFGLEPPGRRCLPGGFIWVPSGNHFS